MYCDDETKDVIKELLNFIRTNVDTEKPVQKILNGQDIVNKCLSRLFNKEEIIKTDANEVPVGNGEWRYNGRSTYEYIYSIIENKLLLVICIKEDVEFGETERIYFRLYPMIDKMHVNFKSGHGRYKYMNILNAKDEMINDFYFEQVWGNYPEINNVKLSDLIISTTLEELEKRNSDLLLTKVKKI